MTTFLRSGFARRSYIHAATSLVAALGGGNAMANVEACVHMFLGFLNVHLESHYARVPSGAFRASFQLNLTVLTLAWWSGGSTDDT